MAGPTLPPRYEPLRPLGKGGGGEVWAVRDRITNRTVALKALGDDADEREGLALVREAVALSGVEGLGVPRVLRFGRLPLSERPYMVRELVEGESLADLLARGGDPRVHLSAIAQAADQLTRLHRALLLHGDLKPANIIVGTDGKASLVDLGLAATWREGGAKPQGLTPRYAAPELFQGDPLTVRVEVFALGATLSEVIHADQARLDPAVFAALQRVVERATLSEPAARYPSADELASALRRAAHLPEPIGQLGAAWRVVGLDGPSTQLLAQIGKLPAGGGIVITGPRLSGRSALLRRIAWSLGVEGQAVAWIEAASVESAGEALTIELAAHADCLEGAPGEPPRAGRVVILVDDAERLGEAELARIEALRASGCRLVLVVGAKGPPAHFPGPTLEMFGMTPLDDEVAGELVRRSIPSLSPAVVAHVVARGDRWPGRIRAIVERLEQAPVVAPADVDRLLEDEPIPATERRGDAAEIHRLLDRGHFDEAADLLARHPSDRSPSMAIARARLATNQGDPARALVELSIVEKSTREDGDKLLSGSWLLHSARAHLRAGDYGEAERFAARAHEELEDALAAGKATLPAGAAADPAVASAARGAKGIAAEALMVCGLAQSYASQHELAKSTLERSVMLAREVGEPRILSLALSSLAFALQRDDHLAQANAAYEEAMRSAEEAGDAGSVATIRLNLASIAKTRGDLAPALAHLEAAVDMGRRSGRTATLRQALLNLANLDLYLGRLARARTSIDALVEQRGDLPPQLNAQLLALEAEHAARSGDDQAADWLCGECALAYEGMGRNIDAAEARLERVLFGAATPGADPRMLAQEVEKARQALGNTTAHRALFALAHGRALALAKNEEAARAQFDEALEAARAAGQRDLMWRALDARASLEMEAGQTLKGRRDREAALALLEEITERLPRDLREVYWNDPRRRALRSSTLLEIASSPTVNFAALSAQPSQDRLARVLEINREIAGEYDLQRLLERVTDHAIALLGAERGFVILRSGHGDPRSNNRIDPASGSRSATGATAAELDDLGAALKPRDAIGAPLGKSRSALDAAPRMSGRDAAPRTSGRDAAPRTSGRDAAPRTSGRDAAPRASGPRSSTALRALVPAADSSDATSDLAIHASRDQTGDDPHGRFSRSIAEKVIKTGEPVVTSSARDDARMAGYVSVHQLMLQSVACVPIRSRNAEVIGALYLETRLRPGATFSEEMPTLLALADQVAIAIETARLVGENERRARELAKANEELEAARLKLEEQVVHRTAQLSATRRELRSARQVLRSHFGYEGMVGTSEAMRRVYALIDRVKDTDVPVLITGESGTGKEIIARAIHNAGPRGKKAFVGINCGAIPEHLLESELFGHVRGAFTGADRDRKGLFRESTEGTILLDEIGEMPQKMQAGLLRVLQEKVVRPVGGTREETVDTRVIAATHRDLSRMVQEGTFREDLYYRLHVIEVRVPPLRERLEDIPILIDHFLGIFAARYSRDRRAVTRPALKHLAAYSWPGNVRQLENVLLNAWVLSDRPELEVEDFELPNQDGALRAPGRLPALSAQSPGDSSARGAGPSAPPPRGGPAASRVETSLDAHKAGERERIVQALSSCNWNRVKAAEVVGLPRRTFYRRLKEYGIQ